MQDFRLGPLHASQNVRTVVSAPRRKNGSPKKLYWRLKYMNRLPRNSLKRKWKSWPRIKCRRLRKSKTCRQRLKLQRSRKTFRPRHPRPNFRPIGVIEMSTKIGIVRSEFLRIGCGPTKDPWNPALSASWYYGKVSVRGNYHEQFDYEMLLEVLKSIPDGAGETFFWNRVRATDFNAMAERLNQAMIEAFRREQSTPPKKACS
jgi:hypothetical protein